MKESDIRPDELMEDQTKYFLEDLKWLIRQKGNFVKVPCPACGSSSSKNVFTKNNMDYMECLQCATIFINPRPTPEILESYYRNSKNYQYWNRYIYPASDDARREKIFKPRAKRLIEICKKNNIKTNLLLEIGAGFGTFIEEIRKYGIFRKIIAVEPTPDLAQTCRGKNIETIETPIERVFFKTNHVDVIACFEVIEHLFSPKLFIEKCSSLLSNGGILVLTCPNAKGFDISILQELSNSVDVDHLNYFNPYSITTLVKESNLEVLELITPGELDAELVRKKILDGDFDVSSQPFLKKVLIDDWSRLGVPFQKFLSDNELSSHLWVVAQKTK